MFDPEITDSKRIKILTALGIAYGREPERAKLEAEVAMVRLKGRFGFNIPHADDLSQDEAKRIAEIGARFTGSEDGRFFALGSEVLAIVNANDVRATPQHTREFLEYFGDDDKIKLFDNEVRKK